MMTTDRCPHQLLACNAVGLRPSDGGLEHVRYGRGQRGAAGAGLQRQPHRVRGVPVLLELPRAQPHGQLHQVRTGTPPPCTPATPPCPAKMWRKFVFACSPDTWRSSTAVKNDLAAIVKRAYTDHHLIYFMPPGVPRRRRHKHTVRLHLLYDAPVRTQTPHRTAQRHGRQEAAANTVCGHAA